MAVNVDATQLHFCKRDITFEHKINMQRDFFEIREYLLTETKNDLCFINKHAGV